MTWETLFIEKSALETKEQAEQQAKDDNGFSFVRFVNID